MGDSDGRQGQPHAVALLSRFEATAPQRLASHPPMIRKLKSGEYRLYSRKKDKTGKRRNLGTFATREKAEAHERAVQYFKRRG
jgi:hypothetical protein